MLKFYKDSALKLEVSLATPKRFLLPLEGGVRTSSLWLGDAYTASVTTSAASGATSLQLDQTFEFPNSGQAVINGMTINYTGKTTTSITGIPAVGAGSLTSGVSANDVIRPKVSFTSTGNILISPVGIDLTQGLKVSLKRSDQSSYAFPGTPVVYVSSAIESGAANAIQVDLHIESDAGPQREFISWSLMSNFITPGGDHFSAVADGYVIRRDQDLAQKLRVLPLNREVVSPLPGFVVGQYRWRDKDQINAGVLVPTDWNIDVSSIGEEKFISGIGHGDDLEPLSIEELNDSLYLRIRHGAYFSGPRRYYLPADHKLEFFSVFDLDNPTICVLEEKPRPTKPVFVGTYRLDGQGFYEKEIEYRYMSEGLETGPSVPTYQFSLDRITKTISVNRAPEKKVLFLGTLSGNAVDYFDLPTYPIAHVSRIYIDRGLGKDQIDALNWTFDREQGTVVVSSTTGLAPSIAGGLSGEAVFAEYDSALAILYEFDLDDTRLITEVDINPAFSGVSGGFFYLQHRRQKPDSIELSCDKPQIQIPPTFQSILGLTAFGPVYFEDDYALLIATAFGKVPGEIVPNARLRVLVDNTFTGLINYKDPFTETIEVITGGDGIANLVFTPKAGFGVWIPNQAAGSPILTNSLSGKKTTTLSNDTIVLPTPVPISQVHNTEDGWLVTLYSVYNTNPLFGLLGGDVTLGEIPFITTGTVGGTNYKTNGVRDAWKSGEAVVRPIQALDINGVNYTAGGFNGMVKSLVFASTVPNAAGTAAYFVSYLQRVTVQLELVDSNIKSNTILLQMEVPQLIVENPWLVLDDDTQGRLNQYRLGWTRPISTQVPSLTP
jgi:hypothetical protein